MFVISYTRGFFVNNYTHGVFYVLILSYHFPIENSLKLAHRDHLSNKTTKLDFIT